MSLNCLTQFKSMSSQSYWHCSWQITATSQSYKAHIFPLMEKNNYNSVTTLQYQGSLLCTACWASRSMSLAALGCMGGWTIISTLPGYILFSCLFGIFLPVPRTVMGTTGTFAFAATVKAPCIQAYGCLDNLSSSIDKRGSALTKVYCAPLLLGARLSEVH